MFPLAYRINSFTLEFKFELIDIIYIIIGGINSFTVEFKVGKTTKTTIFICVLIVSHWNLNSGRQTELNKMLASINSFHIGI